MTEPLYLTPEGAEKLKSELAHLKGPERIALATRLREAIQMGDLSENADYHKAKEDQAFLEGRIQELEYIMANAQVVENHSRDSVGVGVVVTVQEDGEDAEEYHIVGAQEANVKESKISNESPIGSALMNHKVGETVTVTTPGGTFKLKIINIK